ncbi:MAG: hypothetical protein A3F11_02130 [Gammaproteobacteria bacterium RIFCSPHIGHO2_12_FULL_37_14]|nr:MAG: hypothetical protein A3F11_02130 [Gammaproteobacteria bacterium RIFCSPHIGHO2_12_FULL_37_14]
MLSKIIRHRKLFKYCLEALFDLIICKYLVLYVPFRKYSKKFGYVHCETFHENMQAANDFISAIQCALRLVPPLLPWYSQCLDQAMAAQRMLKRRGLQNTLYFGMKHEQDHSFGAHAWVRCGNRWVVGYHSQIDYIIVCTYACL